MTITGSMNSLWLALHFTDSTALEIDQTDSTALEPERGSNKSELHNACPCQHDLTCEGLIGMRHDKLKY